MNREFKISLKAARVNANILLLDAASLIGVSKGTLIKWEKNPGLVNPIYQGKISEVYSIPIEMVDFSPRN